MTIETRIAQTTIEAQRFDLRSLRPRMRDCLSFTPGMSG
jgi:hypothetical protein